MAKPRSDAKLLNLPPDAQERIYAWLTEGVDGDTSYVKVKEQIFLDYSLRVSETALGQFWHKVVAPRRLRTASEAAQGLVSVAEDLGTHFEAGALAACKQKAFEILASDKPDPQLVTTFFGMVLEAQKLDLKREDLAFQRDKFKAAISKKIDLGLAELYEEIKNNPEALALFERMKACVKEGVDKA